MVYALIVVTVTAYGAVHAQHVADDFADYQACASFGEAWTAELPTHQGDTVRWHCDREPKP